LLPTALLGTWNLFKSDGKQAESLKDWSEDDLKFMFIDAPRVENKPETRWDILGNNKFQRVPMFRQFDEILRLQFSVCSERMKCNFGRI